MISLVWGFPCADDFESIPIPAVLGDLNETDGVPKGTETKPQRNRNRSETEVGTAMKPTPYRNETETVPTSISAYYPAHQGGLVFLEK